MDNNLTDNVSGEINSFEYLSALKQYIKGAEGTWYYEGIYNAHTDISHFFWWIDYIEKFGKITGMKALDIGCGSGGMVIALKARGADEAYGLEVDRGLYEICSVRLKKIPSVHIYMGDGRVLPFDDESFDIITSLHVIEHVSQPDMFLGELFRVLKRGGRCVIECPNRLFPLEPHNKIPFITYLPKRLANIICVGLLSKLSIFGPDMRLRLKNVGTFSHFISSGRLVSMVKNLRGNILLENPRERFLGDTIVPRSLSNYLEKKQRLLKFASYLFSRNTMIIFTK